MNLSSSRPVHVYVVIHESKDGRKSTDDTKLLGGAASPRDPEPTELDVLKKLWVTAHGSRVRRESELRQLRSDLAERKTEAVRPLRRRRVARCGLALGGTLGVTAFGLLYIHPLIGISCAVVGSALCYRGAHVYCREARHDDRIQASIPAYQRLIEIEEARLEEDKQAEARSEAALSPALSAFMRPFIVEKVMQHTPVAKDPAILIADYVGPNFYPTQGPVGLPDQG